MRVIHDASSALAKEKYIWDAILTADGPRLEIGYDRRKMLFPLGVEEVRFEDSLAHIQLQLADLVAGAFAAMLRNRIEPLYRPGYTRQLQAALQEFVVDGVWPSIDVEPEKLRTTGSNIGGDPADFIAALLRRAERPPSAGKRSGPGTD